MSTLVWDSVGSRFFETGVDRGVLYLSTLTGVSWNGLLSVTEKQQGEDVTPLYFNGRKYFDFVSAKEYAWTIKAFTYPDQFLEYDGISTTSNNLNLVGQQRKTFGLSYRTLKGNDVSDTSLGYKIHVLYDLTAIPSDIENASTSDTNDPITFEWTVTARPQAVTGYRPTAHVVIDSTKISPALLLSIEDILYGSSTTTARLPTINELITLISTGFTITITDNGDGTWTAVGPAGLITLTDPTTFQIAGINAVIVDANTYQISST